MKKTKNQLPILVVFLLLLTTILSVLVSGTYTKYTKEISGSDTAIVAKFKVSSNLNSADFNIFNTIYDNAKDEEVEEDVVVGKIAPGTEGKFEVTVQNDSEVWVSYRLALSLEEGSNKNIPILYSIDGSNYYTIGQFNGMFISAELENKLKNSSEEVKIPIYWKWDYNSVTDTSIGTLDNQKIIVKVSATFEQLDSQNEKNEFGNNYSEVSVTPDLRTTASAVSWSDMKKPNYFNAAWAFANVDYSNTTVCRIDFPVKNVTNLNDPYITVFVVDNDFTTTAKIISEHKVYVPAEQLGTSTVVNKWVSVTGLNIKVGENQTLAFAKEGDTVDFGCCVSISDDYILYQDVREGKTPGALRGYNAWFDVYVKGEPTLNSTLSGKSMSILGDSISTYAGISDDSALGYSSHAAWYKASNMAGYNMTDENDTWWMQAINNNNMTLEANNSWGGAYVIDGKTADGESTDDPQNSGMIRAEHLGDNPDIIAVFMGANDIIKIGADPGTFNAETYANVGTDITSSTVFVDAYSVMAKRLLSFYPDSDIYLFTIMYNGRVSSNLLDSYNDVIRGIANYSDSDNIHLVDLSVGNGTEIVDETNYTTYLGSDNIHPNAVGMDYITSVFEKSLKEVYGIN